MQGRMKEHPLTTEEINALLDKAKVGHLGSLNADGTPYVTPVHFYYNDNTFYIHGLNQGQKIDNILRTPNVCFEVSEMLGLILDDAACDVNTSYNSVIAQGCATLVEDTDEKTDALQNIVGKYTPQLKGQVFPDKMLKATGVIKVTAKEITGKYYR